MKILVTGGAGYIGTHTAIELLAQGYEVVVVDNFCNSHPTAIKRVEELSGKSVQLYSGDVRDEVLLKEIFTENDIEAVIHFAGLKSVGESVLVPLAYYKNNLDTTLVLCSAMKRANIKKLIFSSSATVYGDAPVLPWSETTQTGIGIPHPYGQTKYMTEQILRDIAKSDDSWRVILLRYFNPIGAHESGRIGEDPRNTPNNLMPYISQVAVGKLEKLHVFGNDYDTPDGTCIRDYIHVIDLAKGHVAALKRMESMHGLDVFNLGTGKGSSVFEVIHAFEEATGKSIPYDIIKRRSGDLSEYYADVSKANTQLEWRATKTLKDACADTWRWQISNPNGFSEG
ncbi:MAG TPA: UDP-glucose 4-epimerase GalE [Candidatus Chromulinivoraceae bacterium]|nr:UDP-glucose 4-epimerase GalE [Candidatus Chromulinivoraceae bacterium]